MNDNGLVEVSLWKSSAVIGICLAEFVFFFIGSLFTGVIAGAVFFLALIAASGLWLMFYRRIQADRRTLRVRSFLGLYEIEWADIDRIEIGLSLIVFFRGTDRLSIPVSMWWSGSQKTNFIDIMNLLIEESQLEAKHTFRADFMFPKGTKAQPVGAEG